METFGFETVVRMSLELSLGVCIKLFCDNGRIHWRDLLNDLFFWVPGVQRLAADGLTREVEETIAGPVEEETYAAIAAR